MGIQAGHASGRLRNLDASDPQRVFFLATKLYHAGRHQEAESCYYKARVKQVEGH